MKKYQIVIRDNPFTSKERNIVVLTTTNKKEAEIVYDGYKATHIVAMLESDIDF